MIFVLNLMFVCYLFYIVIFSKVMNIENMSLEILITAGIRIQINDLLKISVGTSELFCRIK